MCGIVGAVAGGDVAPLLLEGLRRLEYRGYDSAGLAVISASGAPAQASLRRLRVVGKVAALEQALAGREQEFAAPLGIAHTRWATHGAPQRRNAHPHLGRGRRVAVVHNGIIENHQELRERLQKRGYRFRSATDTEVIVHLLEDSLQFSRGFTESFAAVLKALEGAYALAVIGLPEPGLLLAARRGSPLVLGIGEGAGEGGCYLASDAMALPPSRRCITLEDGDIAELRRGGWKIRTASGRAARRREWRLRTDAAPPGKGRYPHYMLKEIHEQPRALRETLRHAIDGGRVREDAFGMGTERLLDWVRAVQIVACGTSYHAGLVGAHWLETLAGVPCRVAVASEFRYGPATVAADSLFVTISQSGETADILASLGRARDMGYLGLLAICNVAGSSLTREVDLVFLTHAGPEIGVASTKSFTTQLAALLLLAVALGRRRGLAATRERRLLAALAGLSAGALRSALRLAPAVRDLSRTLAQRHRALYLGRGPLWPVALEGALKLKEISYIHAEAYPAGELKHGPLALVDGHMPVVALAPKDPLLGKLETNLQEVRARGGRLLLLAQPGAGPGAGPGIRRLQVPATREPLLAPFVFAVPLQLLAYHTGLRRGADVDQPRNLAKSVTVE